MQPADLCFTSIVAVLVDLICLRSPHFSVESSVKKLSSS